MAVDDVRPDRLHGLVVEIQALQALVAHRGGEDVAGLDQAPQGVRRLFLAQVKQHRALVAVDGQIDRAEIRRGALRHSSAPAHDIAAVAAPPARELHLDHVRAQVAQHLGGVGAEDHAGHVEDTHALQRPSGFALQFAGLRQLPVSHRLFGHDALHLVWLQ